MEEINCKPCADNGRDGGSQCCEERVCKLFFFSECISDAYFSQKKRYLFHWLVIFDFINLETYKDFCYPKDETKVEGPMDVPASPGFWRKQLPLTYS